MVPYPSSSVTTLYLNSSRQKSFSTPSEASSFLLHHPLNTAVFSLFFSLCHAYNFLTQRSAPLLLNSQITFFTHSSPQTSLHEALQQAQNDQNRTEFTFSFAYFLLRTPQPFWFSAFFLKISVSSFLLSSTYFLQYIYFKVGQLY